jgi:2-polyprenyl-3-methyl-5-hydroxy-6-metoxy-1,4-benzoquinol methylase
VLDLGCGEGFLSIDIARNHCPKSIYALDIDDRLLERGIARVQKSKLII